MAQDYRPAFGGEGLTMSTYVSPRSLTTKSVEELRQLREKKRRLLHFGLEPGGCVTLAATRTLLPNSSYPSVQAALGLVSEGSSLSVLHGSTTDQSCAGPSPFPDGQRGRRCFSAAMVTPPPSSAA